MSSFTFNSYAGSDRVKSATVDYYKNSNTPVNAAVTFNKNSASDVTVTPASAISLSNGDVFTVKVNLTNTDPSNDRPWNINTITLAATLAASPTITAVDAASIKATSSGVDATTNINIEGSNLTGSTLTATLSPAVEGLSVDLASSAIITGAISTTATLTYNRTANVKQGTTTLTISDGTTSKDIEVTYSAKVVDWTLQSISKSTTWTFNDANITSGSLNQNISAIYANIDGMTFGNDFDATALELGNATWPYYSNGKIAQAKTFKFNTTVAGIVKVTYYQASDDAVYISINGDDNGSASSTSTTEAIAVGVGDVIIKGYTDAEHGTEALLNVSKIEFTQTFAVAYATGLAHGSITGSTTAATGETVTVTATPETGYILDALVIKKASDDSDVTAECNVIGNTFVMPAYAVKVSATFTEVPLVIMPEDTRTGYKSSLSSSNISGTDYAMNDQKAYSPGNGASFTIKIPATTHVSKIKVIGTSADNSTASTVTITGVTGESASSVMNLRKATSITEFEFIPTTQTTTYTILSANKGSYLQIAIYGTENVAKIGDTKWGTFSSTSATTFPVDGISAYKVASIGGDKVIVEPVTGVVPANTGLLLYGNAGEYTIPVAATAGSPVDGNLMTAGTGENVTSGHVLSGKHGDFRPVPDGGVVVPYGKAYLSTTSGTRSLSIAFDDETTGINSVESENNGLLNGDFYNVAGQRVAKPTKGLYIVNGKKVIIK